MFIWEELGVCLVYEKCYVDKVALPCLAYCYLAFVLWSTKPNNKPCGNLKGPMAWKSRFMRFYDMSSPSMPIVPQWLKLAFIVKRALGVLLAFEKTVAQACWFWMCCHKGSKLLPFLCLALPENLVRQWDTTVRAPHVCVCVWLHTL